MSKDLKRFHVIKTKKEEKQAVKCVIFDMIIKFIGKYINIIVMSQIIKKNRWYYLFYGGEKIEIT